MLVYLSWREIRVYEYAVTMIGFQLSRRASTHLVRPLVGRARSTYFRTTVRVWLFVRFIRIELFATFLRAFPVMRLQSHRAASIFAY